MTETFTIAGYCRISVDEELDRDNVSIENQKAIIADFVKTWCPGSTLTFFEDRDRSGYTFEQLLGQEPSRCRCEATDPLLALLDVLVDGPFIQAQYDISLRFRGSANQRLLDMPRSLAEGKPVLWQDKPVFSTHTMD